MPVAFTRAIWADDWADLTEPTDDPSTPGADLYRNQRAESGIDSMPNLVEAAPASKPETFVVVPLVTHAVACAAERTVGRAPVLRSTARAPPESLR